MVTSAVNQFSGPAYGVIGVPTGSETMVNLGLLPNVSVQVQFNRQSAVNEIGQALADGQWGATIGATATLTLHNKQAAILAALINEASAGSNSVSFSDTFAKLTTTTLCIVPQAGAATGVNYAQNMWLPAVIPDDASEFAYAVNSGAGASDSANPYTITYRATYTTSYSLTAGHRIFFIGSPVDAGATFELPTLS